MGDARRLLADLGFSEAEALVYCALLRSPGLSGYGVAKAIGRSQAIVYSALARLTTKGAVGFCNGEARTYFAVPPAELLSGLSKAFDDRCVAARTMLVKLENPVV